MRFYLIIFFLLSSQCLVAQSATVKGKLVDTKTKLPIAGAEIYLEKDQETKAISDENGLFEIEIKEKREAIYVAKLGYEKYEEIIVLKPGEVREMKVDLKLISRTIKETTITTKGNKTKPKSETTTDIEVEEKQANPSGNVESTLKFQGMGVGGNNELGSQYSVRGGSFDENQIYVNDVEVYRPLLIRNAQQEGLSFANSSLIQNMKFSSGGFAAEYGDKLSSILDIQYKKPKKWAGSLEAGLLGASGHIEGTLLNKKLNILSGIRYRNNGYLLGSQETKGEYTPHFLDIQTNIHYQPSAKFDFESLTCFSSNGFQVAPSDRTTNFGLATAALSYRVVYSGQEIDQYKNITQGISLTYKPTENWRIKWTTSLYHIDEKQNFDITGQYAIGIIESDVNAPNFGDFKSVFGAGTFQNWGRERFWAQMHHHQLSTNFLAGKHQFKLGAKLKFEDFSMRVNSWDRLDSSGFNIPYQSGQIQVLNPVKAVYDILGQRYEGYVQDRFTLELENEKKLVLVGGIRANYWTVNQELFISPRVQAFYHPNEKTSIYAAVGSYNQAPFIREMIDEKGILNSKIKSQKSLHYILGYDKILTIMERPFKFTTEAYYKHMWDVNSYQYNNVLIRYNANNDVIAYARGIDFRLQGEFVKDAESWVNIGFLDTKEIDGNAVFMKYRDTTGREFYHRVSGVVIKDSFLEERGYIQRPNAQFYMVNVFFQDYVPQWPKFKVSIALTMASGLPYSVPNLDQYRNRFSLLAYKRLDIGFSYQFYDAEKKGKTKGIRSVLANLDVFNAVDFLNQVSMNWIRDYSGDQFAVPNYLTGRRINGRVIVKF